MVQGDFSPRVGPGKCLVESCGNKLLFHNLDMSSCPRIEVTRKNTLTSSLQNRYYGLYMISKVVDLFEWLPVVSMKTNEVNPAGGYIATTIIVTCNGSLFPDESTNF